MTQLTDLRPQIGVWLVALLAAMLIGAPGMPHAAADDVLVGAIRWDAWFAGSPWAKGLFKRDWNYRLPFFSAVGPHGEITAIDGLNSEVISKETFYASAAGINYFIFGLYDDRSADGSENQTMANFRRSIDLFASLPDKRGMRFSVFLDVNHYTTSSRIREMLAKYVGEPSFLRTKQGEPVIFLFLPTAWTWVEDIGGPQAAMSRQQKLRTDITRTSGKPPYIVVMAFSPADGARSVASVGFDAFTSYGNPLGVRRPDATTGEAPYARCAALSEKFWDLARRTGKPFLPPVSLGWDYRPIADEPTRGKDPEWCHPPTTQDIESIIRDAGKGVPRQQAFRSIVIYAWNEYSEGGWLAPTFCEGAKRLEGLAEALGHTSDLSTALSDVPLPRAGVDCSIPTGLPRTAP